MDQFLSGSVYTSNFDGTIINENIYPSKDAVYLTGGPYGGGSHLDPGDYYFQVTNPSGSALLSTDGISNRLFTIAADGGIDSSYAGTHLTNPAQPYADHSSPDITIQLLPYADTLNNGGEYKLWVTPVSEYDTTQTPTAKDNWGFDGDQKTDNFKVKKTVIPPQQGQIVVTKNALGPDGGSTSFSFTASYYTSGFALNGGTSDLSPSLAPNPYTVTEGTEPAGWTYTNVVWGTTPGANNLGTSTTTTANVVLTAGETVYVTFTDTEATPPGEFPSGIITTTSGDVTLPASPGTVTLNDSATVFNTDPDGIGGTVTFYLFKPGDDGSNLSTAVYTDVVPISGDASAGLTVNTGTGTTTGSNILPTNTTVTGTWNWEAVHSGFTHPALPPDVGNIDDGATDDFGNEPVVVSPASPTLVTTASKDIQLGTTAPTITDSADLEGAYNPTGSIKFTLTLDTGSGAVAVPGATQTDPVTHNGTYGASWTLPTTGTVAGTYVWHAVYTSGDGNNVGADDTLSPTSDETTVVSPATPTLVTTASKDIQLGTTAPTITDSADLEGAYNPTGSIKFTLTLDTGGGPMAVPGATQTDPVTHNGTYGASWTLPTTGTVAGTYVWHAVYTSGDGNNVGTDDTKSLASAETTKVSPATPTLVTTASGNITLDASGAPTITDSADLEGAYNPTGSIKFTLTFNGNPVAGATQTDTVDHNGAPFYTASWTLPTTGTVAGTYLWHAVYTSGDGNNVGTDDTKSATSQEKTVVSKAQPKIVTTAGGTVAAGSGQKMTDSALLTGGYYETGTITFKLFAPGVNTSTGTPVYTDVVTLTGAPNGSGLTFTTATGSNPGGYAPPSTAAAGTYTWTATYSGDVNNNKAGDQGGPQEQETVQNGLTMGFYSNKNGQAALTGSTTGKNLLASVYNKLFGIAGVAYGGQTPTVNGVLVKPGSTTSSVLVNQTGVYQTLASFQSYANVQGFLAGYATATNMANMLSAQLLTLEFNVALGYVDPTKPIQVSAVTLPSSGQHMSSTLQHSLTTNGITATDGGAANIQAIINASIAQLIANPNTNYSNPTAAQTAIRNFQEALKDCLDGINNNEPIFI